MPRITFLTASDGTSLTKNIRLEDGKIRTSSYPNVFAFDSHEVEFNTPHDLFPTFAEYALDGAAMIVGNIEGEPLMRESRAGRASANQMIQAIVFDIDGLTTATLPQVEMALDAMNVTHIRQYSATSMLPGYEGQLHCHLIFFAEVQVHPTHFRDWLLYKNFSQPIFTNGLTLTKSQMALHYTLDSVTYQPSRVIYIAPPTLTGIEDPHPNDRIELVAREHDFIELSFARMPTAQQLKTWKAEAIVRLRDKLGLSVLDTRTTRRKGYDGVSHSVLAHPGPVTITDIRYARGFTYLNLNGGDSWAYYHPDTNAELIHSFKDEEALLTAEVNPVYYQAAKTKARAANNRKKREERVEDIEVAREEATAMMAPLSVKSAAGLHPFYLIDQDGRYKVGHYDGDTREVTLRSCGSRAQIGDFAIQYQLPEPDFIPHVDVKFDPTGEVVFDPGNRRIGELNLYSPSLYKVRGEAAPTASVPTTTLALLNHILGNDEAMRDHYLNWLAFIMQTGRKPQTAWLLSGTTGTGKGTWFHQVLVPLIGRKQAMSRRLDQLEDSFDGELTHTQMLWIDEASVDKLRNAQKLFDKLNNLVTEELVPIRKLFAEHATYASYLAVTVATNSYNGIRIDDNDRRWNVPPRQEHPLKKAIQVGTELHGQLQAELQLFMNYLLGVAVDESAVRTPLESQAKLDLQKVTVDTPAEAVTAIRNGDFDYFADLLPHFRSRQDIKLAKGDAPQLDDLVGVLDKITHAIRYENGSVFLLREDIQRLFSGVLGWEHNPHATAKFDKAVQRYGLYMTRSTKERATGIQTKFHSSEDAMERFVRFYSADTRLTVVKSPTPPTE